LSDVLVRAVKQFRQTATVSVWATGANNTKQCITVQLYRTMKLQNILHTNIKPRKWQHASFMSLKLIWLL